MALGLDLLGEGVFTPCDYHLCHNRMISLDAKLPTPIP